MANQEKELSLLLINCRIFYTKQLHVQFPALELMGQWPNLNGQCAGLSFVILALLGFSQWMSHPTKKSRRNIPCHL